MNVLVVGGAGYVGGGVVDRCLDVGHDVRVYDALLYEEAFRKDVAFTYGDIRDKSKLFKNLEWADTVVWLAALVGDGACDLNPDVSIEINEESVGWLAANYDGRIIFTSTCSVYGMKGKEILTEESPVEPLSIYASTKYEAEKYLQDKNALILRLGTLFGVGDRFSRIRTDLVVNTMTVRAWKDGRIYVYGGEQYRPLLHVQDIAELISDQVDTESTGIYNVSRQNVCIDDLAAQIRNHFPDLIIVKKNIPAKDKRSYRVSIDRALNELHFLPRYTIDNGIDELKRLLDTHRLVDINSPRYTNEKFLSKFNTHLEYSEV